MTISEYHSLSLQKIYKFYLYYGESYVGFLIDKLQKDFYIIRYRDLRDYEKNVKSIEDVGIPVDLNAIVEYHEYVKQADSSISYETSNYTKKATKLIILGAGASFDFDARSIYTQKLCPPLCQELFSGRFEHILDEYLGAKNLGGEIVRWLNSGKGLEEYFQKQWNKVVKTYNPTLLSKIINTQYYIQRLFCDISMEYRGTLVNNYVQLLNCASEYADNSNEKVVFVSFNYDTLLEEAFYSSIKYTFNSIGDYINEKSNLLLFKPHGSWNWVRRPHASSGDIMNKPMRRYDNTHASLYLNNSNLLEINKQFQENISLINSMTIGTTEDYLTEHPLYRNSGPFFPSLLIPYSEKDMFVMPDEHQKVLDHYLGDIQDILVLGWKGTEQLFNQLLHRRIGSKSVDVYAVNNEDMTVFSKFEKAIPNHVKKELLLNGKPVNTFSQFGDYCVHDNGFFEKKRL